LPIDLCEDKLNLKN